MPTRLILIRHGETDWNAEKRYMGSTDICLNARGMAQAKELRGRLAPARVDAIFASSAKRAAVFAENVFEGRLIREMDGLREMGFGVFEGMRYDEISTRYPEAYKSWIDDPFSAGIPGGESPAAFRSRIMEAFRVIISECGGKVAAVVSHGGVIGLFLSELLSLDDIWSEMPGTGDVRVVERAKGGVWERSSLY